MPFSFTEAPIASRQNRRIVGLYKLADRGERERTGLFRFDGVKLLCEAVRREVPLNGNRTIPWCRRSFSRRGGRTRRRRRC